MNSSIEIEKKSDTQDDVLRKIIDLAVQTGKFLQKAETGFLHYHPQHASEPVQEQASLSIPVYENVLFCLALLRTKKLENIQEAKQLLERLLAFQLDQKQGSFAGNFPQYLHEYPQARDHFLASRLLVPFFWIKKDFLHVLGETLSKKFLKTCEDIEKYTQNLPEHMQVPHWVKFACGKEERPVEHSDIYRTLSPQMLGELLAFMQIKEKQDVEFLSFLCSSWHEPTRKFLGSPRSFSQMGYDVQSTLYDYYMGMIHGALSSPCQKPHVQALFASLIRPVNVQGEFLRDDLFISPTCGSWLQKEVQDKNSFSPFYLVLPKHTLTFEVPKGANFHAAYSTPKSQKDLFEVHMEFDLQEGVFCDNIEEAVACSFFINYLPEVEISSENTKATSIPFHAPIHLTADQHFIEIKWNCLSGNAECMAHTQRGNRQGQILTKGKDRFSAFDWQIFLRALRSEGTCRLCVQVRVGVL